METHPQGKEDLTPIIPHLIREILRMLMVVHLGALVPPDSEVLSSPVHLPTTGIIPGMTDLIWDVLLVEEDMEEAIFRAETHMNE